MSDRPRVQLAHLTMARVREYVREPEAVFWTFFFPVLIALALGYAFRDQRPKPVPIGVVEGQLATASFQALHDSPDTEPRWVEPEDVDRALRDGDVLLVVQSGPGGIVYRYDPSRAESRTARLAADAAIQYAAGRRDVRPTTDEAVMARGSRYIDFLVPGLIGLNLLSTGLWGVGYSIVRMRTGKLLKRLMATPMRRTDFLLSFMLARMVFLVGELALLLGFAWWIFDVDVRGSLAAVLLISFIGAFTFTGLGVLVASRARSTEGVSGLMNLAAMPMWILSGVFFSYEHFPEATHPFIRALPLTALLDALRAVINDGASLLATTLPLIVVIAWGVGCFATALAVFRWR